MKLFLPVTLFALAGATSACHFTMMGNNNGGDWECAFQVYLEDEYSFEATFLDEKKLDSCEQKDTCVTLETERIGGKYEFCVKGSMDKEANVDGDLTVQREGGGIVNIKSEKEGDLEEYGNSAKMYYRESVECPDAKPPKATNA